MTSLVQIYTKICCVVKGELFGVIEPTIPFVHLLRRQILDFF